MSKVTASVVWLFVACRRVVLLFLDWIGFCGGMLGEAVYLSG